MGLDLLKVGETGLEYVKAVGTPLGIAKTVCGIGTAFSYTHDWSQKNLKRISLAFGPPDYAALVLETLELQRTLRLPEVSSAKISKLALSILKRSCDFLLWFTQYRFITLKTPVLRGLEGVSILSDLTSASTSLWQELGPTPPADKDLFLSISKVLKVSLLLYVYVADDQRVKVVATGIGIAGDGYSLYQRCRTMNPRTWTITQTQVCQIISSAALAGLTYYAFEKGMFSEVLV